MAKCPSLIPHEVVNLIPFNTYTGNWQQAVHNLSKAQVQDLSGRRGGFIQGHRPHAKAVCAQMVLQGCEAAGPHGHRDRRGSLRPALHAHGLDRVRLLPGRKGQGGEGKSRGCREEEILMMDADGCRCLSPRTSSDFLQVIAWWLNGEDVRY